MNDSTLQQNALVACFGDQKRWVNWQLETIKGKLTKVPYQANGKHAASTRPYEWSTYSVSKSASEKVGIILNDGLLVCIDIDHVIKDGKVIQEYQEQVADIILTLNSYVEISQSGTGLHVFFLTKTPLLLTKHKKPPFEIYNTVRFIAITENIYGENNELNTVDEKIAFDLLNNIVPQTEETTYAPSLTGEEILTDDEILQKMFSAANGRAMKSLYNGDISNYKNKDTQEHDASSADMALCGSLAFWTGRNSTQMERIWLASPLGKREKTQGRKDYRDRTIMAAVEHCTETYTSPQKKKEEIDDAENKDLYLDDLLATEYPPARFALEPFFELGSLNMVSAPPNSWKSWNLIEMSIAMAQGKPFLDHEEFRTEKTNILIVNEEDTERLIADRFKKMNTPKGLGILFRVAKGAKITQKYCEELMTYCLERNIGVVMFDSLRAMTLAEENSSKEMQEVMDAMKMLTRAGLTVIFTHHHKKKGPNGISDYAEASRGSSAINAAVSGHISLEEKNVEGQTTITFRHLKSKVTQKIPSFDILVNLSDDGVSFTYGGEHDETTRGVAKARTAIYDFLDLPENKERWVSKKELQESGIANKTYVSNACGSLYKDGFVRMAKKKDLKFDDPTLELAGGANSIYFRIVTVNVEDERTIEGVRARAKRDGRLISKETREHGTEDIPF